VWGHGHDRVPEVADIGAHTGLTSGTLSWAMRLPFILTGERVARTPKQRGNGGRGSQWRLS
jgi:hypothetical protein